MIWVCWSFGVWHSASKPQRCYTLFARGFWFQTFRAGLLNNSKIFRLSRLGSQDFHLWIYLNQPFIVLHKHSRSLSSALLFLSKLSHRPPLSLSLSIEVIHQTNSRSVEDLSFSYQLFACSRWLHRPIPLKYWWIFPCLDAETIFKSISRKMRIAWCVLLINHRFNLFREAVSDNNHRCLSETLGYLSYSLISDSEIYHCKFVEEGVNS